MRRCGTVRSVLLAVSALAALAALAAPACRFSTKSSTAAPTASSGASPAKRPALEDLSAEPASFEADPKTWQLTLTWSPTEGFTADHYEITRDTRSIAKDVTTTTYIDAEVVPGEKYRYAVVAVAADGSQTKPGVTTVTTKGLPNADARLQGKFIMKMHVTYSNVSADGTFAMLWEFDPACKTGPCDVEWHAKGRSGSGTLTRSDATYSGTIYAPFYILSCHGGAFNETLVFRFHVKDATTIGGAWRATKLEGTLSESASYSGCVTGRDTYSYTGEVQT